MKTFKSTLAGILLPVVIVMMILFACQKDVSNNYVNNSAKNRLSIFLTDGPNDYQQVKVEILGIAIKIDTCRGNGDDDHDSQGNNDDHDSTREKCDIWDTLQIHSGIYDLLTLRNGLDTLLASGFLVKGKVERIKLTLGTNNTVMVEKTGSMYYILMIKPEQTLLLFLLLNLIFFTPPCGRLIQALMERIVESIKVKTQERLGNK